MKKGTKLYAVLYEPETTVDMSSLEYELEDDIRSGNLSNGDEVYVFEYVGKGVVRTDARVDMKVKAKT